MTSVTMMTMVKTVRMRKREFPSKKTFLYGLKPKECVLLRKREAVFFCNGVISIRDGNKSVKIFSTRDPSVPVIELLYCKDDKKTVMFSDENIDENWEQVVAYFFDDEGALFLCAEKYCVSTLGAIFNVVPASEWPTLRQQALNIAAIFDDKLFDEIYALEKCYNSESSDLDMLHAKLEAHNG